MITLPELPERVQTLMDRCEESIPRIKQYIELLDLAGHRKWEASQTVDNLQADYDQVKYQFIFDIETETIDGKKKYSNQAMRDMALSCSLSRDDAARHIAQQIKDAKRLKASEELACYKLRDELAGLNREHAGIVAMLHVYAGVIGVMTNGKD